MLTGVGSDDLIPPGSRSPSLPGLGTIASTVSMVIQKRPYRGNGLVVSHWQLTNSQEREARASAH